MAKKTYEYDWVVSVDKPKTEEGWNAYKLWPHMIPAVETQVAKADTAIAVAMSDVSEAKDLESKLSVRTAKTKLSDHVKDAGTGKDSTIWLLRREIK